jgi:hypothetical protein
VENGHDDSKYERSRLLCLGEPSSCVDIRGSKLTHSVPVYHVDTMYVSKLTTGDEGSENTNTNTRGPVFKCSGLRYELYHTIYQEPLPVAKHFSSALGRKVFRFIGLACLAEDALPVTPLGVVMIYADAWVSVSDVGVNNDDDDIGTDSLTHATAVTSC